jgi:hypothetical protein
MGAREGRGREETRREGRWEEEMGERAYGKEERGAGKTESREGGTRITGVLRAKEKGDIGVGRVRSDESCGVEPHIAAPRGDSWFFWIVL